MHSSLQLQGRHWVIAFATVRAMTEAQPAQHEYLTRACNSNTIEQRQISRVEPCAHPKIALALLRCSGYCVANRSGPLSRDD